jgi:hypothetical protein
MHPRGTPLKPSKNPQFKFSQIILFVNQRKIPKFPQKKKPQLVTLFLVYLREYPFSEISSKKAKHSNLSNFPPVDQKLANSRSPIIKGPRSDLILSVTRLL